MRAKPLRCAVKRPIDLPGHDLYERLLCNAGLHGSGPLLQLPLFPGFTGLLSFSKRRLNVNWCG